MTSSEQFIHHGPSLDSGPQLYGKFPKAGAQLDSVSFHVCYEDVMIPMRDGVKLAGDLYIPANPMMPGVATSPNPQAHAHTQTHNSTNLTVPGTAPAATTLGPLSSPSSHAAQNTPSLMPMYGQSQMHSGLVNNATYAANIHRSIDLSRRWPCVLIRTPYNKSAVNPDLRNPGVYWTQNGYATFIQDCRGRFHSEGKFYKYTGEAEDGYDTVEWLAAQPWCNGSIVTDGPSYLCHVQTSMAILRPPHLKAMFCNKGGFYNAHTSGVRQGGAYEARQWVWGVKNASRRIPYIKEALENVEKSFGEWMRRYPFVRGDSPLSLVPEYEDYMFDQVENTDYNDYWKQIGLNTEEYLDEFADIPALFFSGWYDIYCRSTIDFFTNLVNRKKGPMLLIMGPWQHVGSEGHVAGEVDFGVNALVSGNLAPNMYSLSRRWFDRWVDPVTSPSSKRLTPEEKLALAIKVAEEQHAAKPVQQPPQSSSPTSPQHSTQDDSVAHVTNSLSSFSTSNHAPVHGPYTSLSRMNAHHSHTPSWGTHSGSQNFQRPSVYLLPSSVPRDRVEPALPLPPAVRYFRMGGGDGHRTSQGCLFHGGVWMQSTTWPPVSTVLTSYYLGRRTLAPRSNAHGHAHGHNKDRTSPPSPSSFVPHFPDKSISHKLDHATAFHYDPRDPCPSIGGNVFNYRNILTAGAYNQVEREDMFLCKPPYLPLSSRRDVIVFRTPVLEERLDVTGMPVVHLYISSTAVDTDFTAKLIDEYPPSQDYPLGFAMQITHGILRCRYRNSREHSEFMEPGKVYPIKIELYPTSNLFQKGHRLRLDISSSNFPHFDLNPNTGEEFESKRVVVAENTVFHTTMYPSHIVLPIQTQTDFPLPVAMDEVTSSPSGELPRTADVNLM